MHLNIMYGFLIQNEPPLVNIFEEEKQNHEAQNPIIFTPPTVNNDIYNPYLINGVTEDTNILDLDENQIGVLAGFQDSLSFIPTHPPGCFNK